MNPTDAPEQPIETSAPMCRYCGVFPPPTPARLARPDEVVIGQEEYDQLCTRVSQLHQLTAYIAGQFGAPAPPPGTVDWNMAAALTDRLHAIAAQRGAQQSELAGYKFLSDKLALCMRAYYQAEIDTGRHHQFGDVADAAIHYMLIERDLAKRGWRGRLKYILWGL